MKKRLLLFIATVFSVFSFAQINLQALIKPGAKLTYAVEANQQNYYFIVTVKALTPALVFDWEMTDPVNTRGTISHTATAMVSASTMYNYFSAGSRSLDDNTLSVWLSRNVFTGLTKGNRSAMIRMNTNESPQKMGVLEEDPAELNILVDGEKETVEEFTAKQLNEAGAPAGDDVFFSFASSAKMPVILRMKNGFYIALKEIKTK